MIVVDANVLIYAAVADSSHHEKSRRWLERTLSGSETVGLAWGAILGFLRITTRPGISRRPMSPRQAFEYVDQWLELPNVRLVSPGEYHWQILRNLLIESGTAGNLTSDAHLAAIAIEHGGSICSTDHDFLRFPGVRLINPISEGT